MFESSLLALDPKKPRGKKWLSFPLAVVLHLVVLVSLTFAQYWNVDRVPEPQENAVFVSLAAPPPPPIARGENTSRPTAAPQHSTTPTPPRPAVAQPPNVVPDTPPVPATPQTEENVSTSSDLPPGPTTGDPNGVENGDPYGVLRGTGPVGNRNIGIGNVDDAPIAVSGAVTKPVIVERVEPQYTEPARRMRLEGTVIVQAIIDESGRVVDVKVLKRLPMGLAEAAVDAVSHWRFQPATLYGHPVKVFYSLTVNFRVQ